jgi:hypothetical protein
VRSFTLGLNQMASESSPARFRPSPSPSSPRARLWPLPGRYVARPVSSGEVVAGPSHSASGVHDRTHVSKLVCSLAPSL